MDALVEHSSKNTTEYEKAIIFIHMYFTVVLFVLIIFISGAH